MLLSSCTQYGKDVPNNDVTEVQNIYDAIINASLQANVKKEFIFAIMMQESKGCVRAPTTDGEFRNPGLMQSHNGNGTCNDKYVIQNPCPADEILQMLLQGAGVGTDFGLTQVIGLSGASDDSKYYKGARIYNSGHVHESKDLAAGGATHCYASDIANWLKGWTGEASSCDETTIGTLLELTSSNEGDTTSTLYTTIRTATGASSVSTTVEVLSSSIDIPKIEGAVANCQAWYTIKQSDTCGDVAAANHITLDYLRSLNLRLNDECTNLWLGYAYCISESVLPTSFEHSLARALATATSTSSPLAIQSSSQLTWVSGVLPNYPRITPPPDWSDVQMITYNTQTMFDSNLLHYTSDPFAQGPKWEGEHLSLSWQVLEPFPIPTGYVAPNIVPKGSQVGHLTYFNPGLGACGIPAFNDSDPIVAISWEIFDLGKDLRDTPFLDTYNGTVTDGFVTDGTSWLCNRFIRVWMDQSRSIEQTFMVRDRCTGCRGQDIDIQPDIFSQFWAEPSVGRISVTWEWVPEATGL
jgi:hypothetical protein